MSLLCLNYCMGFHCGSHSFLHFYITIQIHFLQFDERKLALPLFVPRNNGLSGNCHKSSHETYQPNLKIHN